MRKLTVLLCLFAIGCAELEPGDGRFPDLDAALAEADGSVIILSDGGADELKAPAGQWALFVEDRRCFSVLGARAENVIWSWYLVDIDVVSAAASPTRLRMRPKLCNQTITPLIGALQTFVPQRLLDRLPVPEGAAFLFGPAPGAAFLSDAIAQLWGATGLAPGDPLPTDVNDPSVDDLDEDGEPGVTFVVGTEAQTACEVRVVQRTVFTLSGQVVDATQVRGQSTSSLDQVVLASTAALCSTEAQFAPSPVESRFVLLRIDGQQGALDLDLDGADGVGCGELLGALPALEQGPLARIELQPGVCD